MQNDTTAKRAQKLYIIQAAVEYLVSILVAGSFLATLTNELGFSDSLTGIVSSIISLGCLFQLLAVLIRKRIKTNVIILSLVSQILFLLLYVIPLTGAAKPIKTVLFVAAIVLAYLLYNIIHPQKTNWLMSSVGDGERGVFTANKEIVSLVVGMAFSLGMGELVDVLAAHGNIRMAFLLCAIVIFALMVWHAVTLFFVPGEEESGEGQSIKNGFFVFLRNKQLRAAVMVSVLYNVAAYAVRPFLGSYQIKELGFGLGFVGVLSIVSSVARIAVSHRWGRYADRRGFAVMVEKCFFVLSAAWICVAFAAPAIGMGAMLLYYILNGVAMGGINSAMTNLIYDYVPRENCADAIAVTQALAGVAGFVSTLIVSPIVTVIQTEGNRVLGLPIYAQQVLAIIGLLITVIAMVFTRVALIWKRG